MHGSPISKKLLIAGLMALVCALAGFCLAGPVAAQAMLDISQPGGLMRMQIGAPQVVQVGTQYWVRPAGRFQLWTGQTAPRGGDPTRTGDEDLAVVSKAFNDTNNFTGFTSMLQFSVDNTVADATGVLFDTYAAMNAVALANDPGTLPSFWPVPLEASARAVTGTSLVPLTDEGTLGPCLTVFHNYELIGDALMLELVITNSTPDPHAVGVRWALDTGFGGAGVRDGSPIFLPDGSTIESERVLPGFGRMPAGWVSYDDPTNPLVSMKGVLDAPEVHLPGFANSAAGVPDTLEFGRWGRLAGSGFNFIANPGLLLTGEDWGVGVKWSELNLPAGESRRYVTYIAYGASVASYETPCAVMSYAPRRLQEATGDDPSTPDVVESVYLTDGQGRSPFPVSVFVDNFGSGALSGTSATISLPTGLSLLPGTQPRTQAFGVIPRDGLIGATWTLSAAQAQPGVARVGLTGPRGRVVDRDIIIPSLPILNPRLSVNGLDLISIPYQFTNNDAEHVFQSLGGLEPGQAGSLIRWDPVSLLYRWFPDPFVTNVEVGKGYWLLNRDAQQIVLPSDAQPLPALGTVSIELTKGWNMIGNPFTLSVNLADVQVITPRAGTVTMTEAVNQALVQPTAFSYNPQTQQYEWQQELRDVRLDPFLGYWILAYDDITLVVSGPRVASVSAPAVAPAPVSGWRAAINLSGGGAPAAVRAFGVAPDARDGVDPRDLIGPPAPLGSGLQAAFVGEGGEGAPRMVDLQADDGQAKTWYLKVSAAGAQRNLKLSWADLSAVPDKYTLVLEDVASGARCYMRTTAGYPFQMREAGSRLFKISAEPRSATGALLTSAQAQAAPGGRFAISYALAAPASIDVVVRNIAGVVIRRVTSGQVAAAGANRVLWNARSDNGSLVPAGRYLCEITARSPESGQVNSMIVPLEMSR